MAEVLGQAVLELTTDQSQLDKGLKGLGSSITGAGAALTGLTAPLDAIGVSAIKMGMDFEDSLNHIVGLVGISREQVNAWKEDIYALSGETARSPKELAEALYFITSSGVDAADALDVLRASAQASAAGLGETQIIADAVTSAMNAYGASNLSAAQATSVLVAMVRVGKGEAESFAPVLAQVIPIAATLGVSFEQVGAALAFFTRFGMPASEAATSLKQILQSMVKPARQEAEALAEVGLSFQQLQATLKEKGLLATLQMLNDRVGGNTEALAKIFPRVQGLTGLLALLGENAGMAEEVFADLADTIEAELAVALAATTEGPGFKMRQMLVNLQTELLKFGDMILPIVAGLIVPAAGKAADAFGALVKAFQALPEPVQKVIVVAAGMVAALGPALMMAGLLITAFAMLSTAAPGAAVAMLGFSTGLLSVAAPAAAVIALAAILGTDMKDLAIVVGLATAAFLLFRSAAAVSVFTSLISGLTGTIGVFLSLAATEGVAASGAFALSTAFTALRGVLLTLPGAIAAIAIGFIALDAIAKVAFGYGLIDMITGSGHAADVAAEYLKKFGSAADYVSVAMENGPTEVDANAAALDHYGRLLEGAIRQAVRMRDEGVDDVQQWEAVSEAINGHKEQILALTPSYEELLALIEEYPPLLDVLGGDLDALKAQWQAVQMDKIKDDWHELAGKINAVGLALTGHKGDVERAAGEWQAFLTDIETAGKAMDNLASVVLAKMGLSLRQLELEKRKNELEALGDAAPAGELEAVNTELEAMGRFTQDVTLRMKILGQRLFDALGENAAAEIDKITKQLYAMPTEMMFQVLPLLDVLAATQIARFMDLLKAGVTVPIAFAVAKFNMPSFAANVPGPFGDIVSKLVSGVGQLAMTTVPATKGVSDFQNAVSGAGSASGGAAAKVDEVKDVLEDGAISLAEAAAQGIPAWVAARAEMDATATELTTGEKAWRAQVDLLKLLYACIDAGVDPALLGFNVLLAAAQGDVQALNTELGKFLSDGVVSLEEALKAGLNPAQQAAIELTYARAQAEEDAAEAANRATVELIKLRQSMDENGVTDATVRFWAAAQMANEGTLNLVETLKLGLAPAQGAAIQAFSDEIAAREALKQTIWGLMVDMDLFLLQLQDIPGYAQAGVRELYNLGVQIGNEGLGRQALDFELAMQEVRTSFGEGRTAASQFAYSIGTELVGQLQGALGQLLSGPTVETANLQLQIDTLQYQLAVQEAAGATQEQTQAIRDQIAALQAQLSVYTADHRVMQDRAILADQTLPTERELKDMVATITENIRTYSGYVDALTWATGIQTLATANTVKETDNLGTTVHGATDYLGFFTRGLGDSSAVVTEKNLAQAAALGDYVIPKTYALGDATGYAGPKTWNLGDAAAYAAGILNGIHAPEGFQSGGIASGLSLVGEHGPELIWAPPNTRVFAHGETPRLQAILGGPSVPLTPAAVQLHIEHLELPGVRDVPSFVREIMREAGKLQERAARGV